MKLTKAQIEFLTKLVAKNKAKPSKPAKKYQITPDKHLNKTEERTLRLFLDEEKSLPSLAIRLLLETGARVTELLNLEVSDIQHDSKSIAISGIKKSLDRVIPLTDSTYSLLCAHLPQQGLVFTFKKRWLQHLWTTVYAPASGTDKTLHCLRHTFALNLLDTAKKNPETRNDAISIVQSALGHVNIQNTLEYAFYLRSSDDIRKALKGA